MPEQTQVRQGQPWSSAGCTRRCRGACTSHQRTDAMHDSAKQPAPPWQPALSGLAASPAKSCRDEAVELGGHVGLGLAWGSPLRAWGLPCPNSFSWVLQLCCSHAGYECIGWCPARAGVTQRGDSPPGSLCLAHAQSQALFHPPFFCTKKPEKCWAQRRGQSPLHAPKVIREEQGSRLLRTARLAQFAQFASTGAGAAFPPLLMQAPCQCPAQMPLLALLLPSVPLHPHSPRTDM